MARYGRSAPPRLPFQRFPLVRRSTYTFRRAGVGNAGNSNIIGAPTAPLIAVGDLLIAAATSTTSGSSGNPHPALVEPAGWTAIPTTQTNPFINESTTVGVVMGLYYRWATGSDAMPTWDMGTGATLFKYAANVYSYAPSVAASGMAPQAYFAATPAGVSSTNIGPAPIATPAQATTALELFTSRSTTNTSYAPIAGRIQRNAFFGSGGGAEDLAMYDTGMDVPAGVAAGGDTAVAGIAAPWGISALIFLPQPAIPVGPPPFVGWGVPF